MRRPEPNLCMMSVLSKCNVILEPESEDPNKRGRRGICMSDYTMTCEQVRDGRIEWEEVEGLGLCKPVKRDFTKRLLRTVLAQRKTG